MARTHMGPAISYDACIRSYVPFTRADGPPFTVAGCPSHAFFMFVRRAIPTSKNPQVVRSVVAGWHEQEYHGNLVLRWNAILALAEQGARPFWFATEQEAISERDRRKQQEQERQEPTDRPTDRPQK